METPDKEYCECILPIKVKYGPKEGFKIPHCSFCLREVDPRSKAVAKFISKLDDFPCAATRNEMYLKDKINEIIELIKANGDMQ